MATLFETVSIKGLSLPNRFVRSATWEGLADNGGVTEKLTETMTNLVKGEVGLIISGYAFVSPEGQSSPGQLAVYDDRFLPGLKRMTSAVHAAAGKIALQIVHGGCAANRDLTGLEPVGASPGNKNGKPACREAGKADIAGIVSAFAKAALRAKEAGFDAVQLHGAHGFLLSQFLSPAFNKRTDEYGGSLENRARLLLEVIKSIRQAVGSGYPLLIKLNSEDFLPQGLTRTEAIEVSLMLQEASIDAIEFSGGTVASPEKLVPPRPGKLETLQDEVYYREAARLFKQKVAIPLMLVGGIRSYEAASELVESGQADFISFGRPLISEPGLVKRWHQGDRRKAECGSCNSCFGPAIEGRGIYCVAIEKKRQQLGS
jgi:2,4-dienoyl-CoA reductase-like NADH-dependent reductase (Old Yellow Enzyme family)